MSTDLLDCKWGDSWWPAVLQLNFTATSDIPTSFYGTWANHIGKMTLTLDRISGIDMKEEEKRKVRIAAGGLPKHVVGVDGWHIFFTTCMALFRFLH